MRSDIRSMFLLTLAVFVVVVLSCGDETLTPTVSPTSSEPSGAAGSLNSGPSVDLLRLRPTTVEELVSGVDVIFAGTVVSLISEREIGPYGPVGYPDPAGRPLDRVTDYAVSVLKILKSDGFVSSFGIVTLRMPGHAAPDAGFALSVATVLPEVGEQLLFLLGRNPDGSYSAGDEGLLIVDGESVKFHDGTIFGKGTDVERLLAQIEALGR